MSTFQDVLKKSDLQVFNYRAGDNAKGIVIDSNGHRILVELPGGVTGIITKKEAGSFADEDAGVEAGMEIEAAIIESENDHGLVVLSLRKASQDMVWAEMAQMLEEERSIKVKADEANKGGLMVKYKGIKCFLPVSQLMPQNYPRVNNADSAAILQKLQDLLGKEFLVRVINVDREQGKVILSEKSAYQDLSKRTLENLNIGDVVKGTVTGVVKFGIFVAFGGLEGLVHLSELDWGHTTDASANYKLNDDVEVMVIGIEGKKLSLSVKRLGDDPWKDNVDDVKEGQIVEGPVVRWNTHGVFIQIKPEVQGFFSLDQFPVETHTELPTKMNMKEGMVLKGEIYNINYDSHRLDLKLI